MKAKLFIGLFFLSSLITFSQNISVSSPNQKINIEICSTANEKVGAWYFKVNYSANGKKSEIIPEIALGITRSDQDFSKELKFLRAEKIMAINENYTAIHGKRSQCSNVANEIILSFENPSKAKLNIIIRAYDDGVTFRYEFPEKSGSFVVKDELTAYSIPDSTKRWLEKFNPANEGLYSFMKDGGTQQDWAYPALFNTADEEYWYLIHEADLDRNYCGTKLSNTADGTKYKLTVYLQTKVYQCS